MKGTTQGGRPWNKAHLYRLLHNRKYLGEVEHKGTIYPGEHEAIVPRDLWYAAHRILAENHHVRGNRTRAKTPALLRGLLRCAHCDCSMGPTFTRKKDKTYRYYLCVQASKRGYRTCPVRTVAAGTIEEAVVEQLRLLLRSPERLEPFGLHSAAVTALARLDALWDHLFPAEQERLVRTLLERIDVHGDGLDLHLRAEGLRTVAEDAGIPSNRAALELAR